jgi:hypothetical protein
MEPEVRSMLILSSHLLYVLLVASFLFVSGRESHTILRVGATCPAHFILPDLIVLIISAEK